ncbi:MAG: hypothetical protein ACLR2E_24065 [Lachnospiraceae bacterium]
MLTLRGESGLLENLPNAFVDWSISNKEFNLQPINVPNNCLAVCLLERAAEMYRKPEWAKTAQEMRTVIEGLTGSGALFGADGTLLSWKMADSTERVLRRRPAWHWSCGQAFIWRIKSTSSSL